MNMKPGRHPAMLAAAVVVLRADGAFGQMDAPPEYHVTRMGEMIAQQIPGSATSVSQIRGLNRNGDAVGTVWVSSQNRARVHTVEHGVIALPLLPALPSNIALDVSDRDAGGEIVIVGAGLASLCSDTGTAALWRFSTVSGEVLETRAIGALPGSAERIAVAVNNGGAIVGCSASPFAPGNGVPDECEAAHGGLDGNGTVDVTDLLVLLANWG